MKMAILPKAMFKAIPIKIPMILHRNRKINPKIHMKTQKTSNSQRNSEHV
jgi:hypothetical protein